MAVTAGALTWAGAELTQGYKIPEMATVFFILFVTLFTLSGWIVALRDLRRCSSCGRRWALRKTGKAHDRRTDDVLRSQPPVELQWCCKHCGETVWLVHIRARFPHPN